MTNMTARTYLTSRTWSSSNGVNKGRGRVKATVGGVKT